MSADYGNEATVAGFLWGKKFCYERGRRKKAVLMAAHAGEWFPDMWIRWMRRKLPAVHAGRMELFI